MSTGQAAFCTAFDMTAVEKFMLNFIFTDPWSFRAAIHGLLDICMLRLQVSQDLQIWARCTQPCREGSTKWHAWDKTYCEASYLADHTHSSVMWSPGDTETTAYLGSASRPKCTMTTTEAQRCYKQASWCCKQVSWCTLHTNNNLSHHILDWLQQQRNSLWCKLVLAESSASNVSLV